MLLLRRNDSKKQKHNLNHVLKAPIPRDKPARTLRNKRPVGNHCKRIHGSICRQIELSFSPPNRIHQNKEKQRGQRVQKVIEDPFPPQIKSNVVVHFSLQPVRSSANPQPASAICTLRLLAGFRSRWSGQRNVLVCSYSNLPHTHTNVKGFLLFWWGFFLLGIYGWFYASVADSRYFRSFGRFKRCFGVSFVVFLYKGWADG